MTTPIPSTASRSRWHAVVRDTGGPGTPAPGTRPDGPRVRAALDVPAMARAALMSPSHFTRQFRAAYGETRTAT